MRLTRRSNAKALTEGISWHKKILRHQKARDGFTTKSGTILLSVPMPQQLHTVIFDLGGVVLDSPLPAIAAYEADIGLPHQLIARLVTEGGTDGGDRGLAIDSSELAKSHRSYGQVRACHIW